MMDASHLGDQGPYMTIAADETLFEPCHEKTNNVVS